MQIRTLPIADAAGNLLINNIFDDTGRKLLTKGTLLGPPQLEKLRASAHKEIDVGILAEDDLHEDEAARRVAQALLHNAEGLRLTRAVAGRVNVHTKLDGVLYVDGERLIRLNSLPGVTVATRRQHATIGPSFETTQVATLKIIPVAIPNRIVREAERLAEGVLRLLPLVSQRIGLLITSDNANVPRLMREFETPTRTRLERLGSELTSIEAVELDEQAIASSTQRLLASHDALIIGGQTSIMDLQDMTPRALSRMGASVVVHGAPVEPGNLLALAYYGSQWLLCAPGCAKSPELNLIDLLLPRLLAGERLEEAQIAEMGLGGLL